MITALADTHTIIWYLHNNPRLSAAAHATINTAVANGDQIAFSAITFVEMVYLIEKGRIAADAVEQLLTAIAQPKAVLVETPLDRTVINALTQVDRAVVPDMPDRIIAATALLLGVPVISKDSKIRVSNVPTIW